MIPVVHYYIKGARGNASAWDKLLPNRPLRRDFRKSEKAKLAKKRMKIEGSTADQMETLLLICVLTFCLGIIYPAFYDPAYMTRGVHDPEGGMSYKGGGGNGGWGGGSGTNSQVPSPNCYNRLN